MACFWKVDGALMIGSCWGFKTLLLGSKWPRRTDEGERGKNLWLPLDRMGTCCCCCCCNEWDVQFPSRERMVPDDRDEWTERLSPSLTEPRRPDNHAMRCFERDSGLFVILPVTLPVRDTTILREPELVFFPNHPRTKKNNNYFSKTKKLLTLNPLRKLCRGEFSKSFSWNNQKNFGSYRFLIKKRKK